MARNPTKDSKRVDVNTFAQGLITEASPLNFPPNASVNEENFEINRDGSRDRRRGMDLERGAGVIGTGRAIGRFSEFGTSSYVWTGAAGNAGSEFIVVQLENQLYIFDSKTPTLGAAAYIDSVVIPSFPTHVKYSFSTVDGNLVVVAGTDTFITVEYTNPGFVQTPHRIKVRDVWGLEIVNEGANSQYEYDDNYRGIIPISGKVAYNLQNQSWGIPRRQGLAPDEAGLDQLVDPISYFAITHNNTTPSNSETVSSGLQFKPVDTTKKPLPQPSEQMFPYLYDDVRGNTPKAAKGYFIIDLFRRGESRLQEVVRNLQRYPQIQNALRDTIPDYSPGGPTVVRQFAGRAFFAGFSGVVVGGDKRSPNLSNFVVFSQVVRNLVDLERCYQEGDPTSREGNDIVDTDGGFIKISGADKIVGLRSLGATLIVFATNGIWEIAGGSDYGFGATNHKVTKLSSVGTISPDSIVEEVGKIYYWARDGIYVIGPDQFQSVTVQNISQKTIQSYYENLSPMSKENAIGVYDLFSKKVRWVFNQGVPFDSSSECFELVFDTVVGCFYPNRIGSIQNQVEVTSLFLTSPYVVGLSDVAVMVDTEDVYTPAGLVTVEQEVRRSGIQAVKYLAWLNQGGQLVIGFSYYNNTSFRDWENVDGAGVDAKAFLISGAQTVGDSAIDKQVPYITMHFIRTENGRTADGEPINQSSCLMRCQWDFSNSPESNKWSPLVQTYRYVSPKLILDTNYDNGFEILSTKNKLRGRGKAFALYLETEEYKDCRILGWNIAINGNAVV